MKSNQTALLSLLGALLLGSCSFPFSSSSSSSSSTSSSDESISNSENSSLVFDSNISSSESSSHQESISSSSEETSSSSQLEINEKKFKFYCVNDFHGSILENSANSKYEAGIKKYFGELKRLKEADPEHTILLSAGDMWQGSLESNYYYGEDVVEAMNETGFDAMALGNHEFDYGQEKIFENLEKANFPFLAGNIVKWSNGLTSQKWDERIKSSTTLIKDGVKIGIVGMIGTGQTTSIMSKNVEDIGFANAANYARLEANKLKKDGCEIVVLAIHDNYESISSISNLKDYFDGVFTAHTHVEEKEFLDDVPVVQGTCNGRAYSYFELTYNNKGVSCLNNSYGVVYSSSSWKEDSSISKIVDTYIKDEAFLAKANSVAGTLSGGYLSSSRVAILGCAAMYDKYKDQGVQFAIENGQRASIQSGTVTYSDIYKATPFMNEIVIAKAYGYDIESTFTRNCYYPRNFSLDNNTLYTFAVIDYLFYHQNESKNYNYFTGLSKGRIEVLSVEKTYPFDLTFEYIKKQPNSTIYAGDYA